MKALITGITGQDGYFLSQYLLQNGYEVHGLIRRNSNMTKGTFDILPKNIKEQINIDYGDISGFPNNSDVAAKYILVSEFPSFIALTTFNVPPIFIS